MPNVVREARFIKSDVENNNNKFWYITEFDDCTCVVQFGRVGGDGANKTHNFSSQGQAARFFDSKCREKQGDRKGYRPLQVLNGATGNAPAAIARKKLEKVATEQIVTNSPETQALVRYLTQANVHNILAATTMKYDVDKGLFTTPCGIVSQDGIDTARTLLSQIGDFVAAGDFRNVKYAKILNDYLMLIPQKVGRKLDPATLYPDVDAVQKQNDILDSLDASLQTVLAKPENEDEPEPPKLFEVKLHLIAVKKDINRIQKIYQSTMQAMHACAHLDVKTVYEVEIASMERPFAEKGKEVGNIMELWHGTRASNLLSILKSGFLIPPSNAPHCTGRMFGNGVYFSDQSTKSLNYAYGYWGGGPRDNNCFMFLVDVAMGKIFVPSGPSADLPKPGYDSTFAKAGESGVMNNEMIVYQTYQVNPRFLVEFAPKA
jgi:poly [ADP-ribose] polymerase